jgi:hypothetical protein
MKSIINESKEEPKSLYPCLKIAPNNLIVLFTGKTTGTIIHEADENSLTLSACKRLIVGYHSDIWSSTDFEIFNGSITLSN